MHLQLKHISQLLIILLVSTQVVANGKDSLHIVKPIAAEEAQILESLDSMTALLMGGDNPNKLNFKTIKLEDSVKFPVFSDSIYK